jgi:hypothetical protein
LTMCCGAATRFARTWIRPRSRSITICTSLTSCSTPRAESAECSTSRRPFTRAEAPSSTFRGSVERFCFARGATQAETLAARFLAAYRAGAGRLRSAPRRLL